MANEHGNRTKTFRPDPDEYGDAKTLLADRSWPMEIFLRACLRCLRDQPDTLLQMLTAYRPEPRPLGRPSPSSPREGLRSGSTAR